MQCKRRCTADMTAPSETSQQRSLLPPTDVSKLRTSLGKTRGLWMNISRTTTSASLANLPVLLKKTATKPNSTALYFLPSPIVFRRRKHGAKPAWRVGEKPSWRVSISLMTRPLFGRESTFALFGHSTAALPFRRGSRCGHARKHSSPPDRHKRSLAALTG